jgi:hypothetical protein
MPPKTAASSLALVIELAKESPARLHDVIQFHRRRSFEAIEVTHGESGKPAKKDSLNLQEDSRLRGRYRIGVISVTPVGQLAFGADE